MRFILGDEVTILQPCFKEPMRIGSKLATTTNSEVQNSIMKLGL